MMKEKKLIESPIIIFSVADQISFILPSLSQRTTFSIISQDEKILIGGLSEKICNTRNEKRIYRTYYQHTTKYRKLSPNLVQPGLFKKKRAHASPFA